MILPGLGIALGVVGRRLRRREDSQRARRQLRTEEQRLERRDERVPPEDGHEPRRAGGEQVRRRRPPARASGAPRDPRATGSRCGRGRPSMRRSTGAELCHSAIDCSARRRSSSSSRANDVGRQRLHSLELGLHADHEPPAGARLEREREPGDAPRLVERLREVDDGPAGERAVREDERPVACTLRRMGRRQRHVDRTSEAGLEILDDEDVGEVGGELQPELDIDAAMAVVLRPRSAPPCSRRRSAPAR